MLPQERIQTYEAFWPYYVMEHSRPANRLLHFIGTTFGFFCFSGFLLTLDGRLILVGLVTGYAFAWVGHYKIEKNRPATFKYPLWSFISDWKMWALILSGRMGGEIERCNKLIRP